MSEQNKPKYPLLMAILAIKGMELQATYSNADVANLFETSTRTIQNHSADGSLPSRKLPGRARFFPVDIETYLENSAKKKRVQDD